MVASSTSRAAHLGPASSTDVISSKAHIAASWWVKDSLASFDFLHRGTGCWWIWSTAIDASDLGSCRVNSELGLIHVSLRQVLLKLRSWFSTAFLLLQLGNINCCWIGADHGIYSHNSGSHRWPVSSSGWLLAFSHSPVSVRSRTAFSTQITNPARRTISLSLCLAIPFTRSTQIQNIHHAPTIFDTQLRQHEVHQVGLHEAMQQLNSKIMHNHCCLNWIQSWSNPVSSSCTKKRWSYQHSCSANNCWGINQMQPSICTTAQ